MKIKRFLLNEDTQRYSIQYMDLITFDEPVDTEDILKCIERAKKIEDYTNEDVYKELETLGTFTVDWIGGCYLFEY